MKANSKMVCPADLALLLYLIIESMKANLRTVENTVREYKFLLMEIGMRDSLRMIFKMALVLINGVMDVFIKDNLKMGSHMVRGNI